MQHDLHLDGYVSFTIAILLLFVGKACTRGFELLRRYSIPEAVMGGLVCIAVVSALYLGIGLKVDFQLGVRDDLLLYFFAAIGLGSDVRTLRQGGRPLVVLVALSSGFIVLQNLVGMAMASAFGLDHRAGLLTGSIALTGGVGTTLAWAPHFARELGIANAETLGLASNMAGLIAACAVGGPIAAFLLRRYRLVSSAEAVLPPGGHYEDEERARLDYNSVLMALRRAAGVHHGAAGLRLLHRPGERLRDRAHGPLNPLNRQRNAGSSSAAALSSSNSSSTRWIASVSKCEIVPHTSPSGVIRGTLW
ncbi:sodium--glutamate symport carrier (gltS) [Variovorax sp. HW608]|uniref:sodium/glutamate symporter n=1 Tax=Variovorax sp. HW608 TaxID=1034889 RepID=UPI00081FF3B0|nr:sodium/glutamate symporter [Variovorax sp. HW608]SCK16017.1 sodium--glutamate symport carrier (gltS) [Variovorax sp. HW608]